MTNPLPHGAARLGHPSYAFRMITLTPEECRVLGVLVEKAQTTPQQYPMTVNGLIAGCNQKNNRDPITNYDEDTVLDALDSLRGKGLARQVEMSGSRVPKYRHVAREALEVDTSQLVVLTEMLLRGPQTLGELRGRASRMHPLESLDVVKNILATLMERAEPLVKELPPAPGSRAERYAHLLCPSLIPKEGAMPSAAARTPTTPHAVTSAASGALEQRVDELEQEVRELKDAVARIEAALGQSVSHPTSAD